MKKINKTILLVSILISATLLVFSVEKHGLESGANNTNLDYLPRAESLRDMQIVSIGGCFREEVTVGLILKRELNVCLTCCEHPHIMYYLPALPLLLTEITGLSVILYFLLNYLKKFLKK